MRVGKAVFWNHPIIRTAYLWVWESSTFQYFLLYLRSIRKRQVLKRTIFVVALNCNQRASSASLHRSSTPFADRFYIADSAQTEYCTTFHFPCLRPSVTGVTSHISHIYKGINAMLIITGPINPYIFWFKIILAIFLAKTRPDKTFFSALTNLTIDFDFK